MRYRLENFESQMKVIDTIINRRDEKKTRA